MKILFLDQSGQLGGAELCLADLAAFYGDRCSVGLLADGTFRTFLEHRGIAVRVLHDRPIAVRKDSGWLRGITGGLSLLPTFLKTARLAQKHDLLYANTPKALIAGSIAASLARRPLIYHLHDILSAEHFSPANRAAIVALANRFASLVIANSRATETAFREAGGKVDRVAVVYNGFDPGRYEVPDAEITRLRREIAPDGQFIVGHFSRLSPWKGQDVLLDALARCPEETIALFIGSALFGEDEYVNRLHERVSRLGLEKRVKFLGFREDIPRLMAICDLIAHTSTAPEPFGRVIVEGMLAGRPVVAAAAGGAIELVQHDETGWLVPPRDPEKLAETISLCYHRPDLAGAIARRARVHASRQFDRTAINRQIDRLLDRVSRTFYP
ncbi:glycosyltransferase [Pannus brasiliensis CCIBt3594]|uniref:Glycosyltransferase n=1 Tax=Pannus brasiliensis CCIBt3594 TaxID=1427578 RepID=A0AAW9QTQ1_9CHRO